MTVDVDIVVGGVCFFELVFEPSETHEDFDFLFFDEDLAERRLADVCRVIPIRAL